MKNILSIFLFFFCCLTAIPVSAQVVVAADKMNVLYIGVDNPISIAVPGYSSEKISVQISKGGTLTQVSPGKFIAHVTEVDYKGETVIEVSVEIPDGTKKLMGEANFRVKKIPAPTFGIGGQNGGEIKTPVFKVQRGVSAYLENFDFDARFNILEFEMTYVSAENTSITLNTFGPLFSKEMLEVITQSKPGDKFFFDKVKAKGPDGTIHILQTTVFYLI